MAMDDIYKLAKAISQGEMAKPSRVDNLVVKGPWIRAHVKDATLHIDHDTGVFDGVVKYTITHNEDVLWEMDAVHRFRQDSKSEMWVSTFHDLWLSSWTLPPEEWPEWQFMSLNQRKTLLAGGPKFGLHAPILQEKPKKVRRGH